MNAFWKRLIEALLLVACAGAMAQVSTAPEKPSTDINIPGHRSFSVLHEANSTTGTILQRETRWSLKIPLDKTYQQLTPEEKADFHAMYEAMPPGDEPPFPLTGMRPVFSAIRKGQEIVHARGRLNLVVTVDAEGKATQVADLGGLEGRNADQMTQFAGSVLLMTKFKPAICDGRPCPSQFPVVLDLRTR